MWTWNCIMWLRAHNSHSFKETNHNYAYVIFENVDKSTVLLKLCFFQTLRDPSKFFPHKYSTIIFWSKGPLLCCKRCSQISQINKSSQASYAGHWNLCSSFFYTNILWLEELNIGNQSQLGIEKKPCFDLFSSKSSFFPVFSLWKWIILYEK